MTQPPTVFLDKDGTLIRNRPYSTDPASMRLMPGAGSALWALHKAGYRLIVISNQPGIGLGYFTEAALGGVRARLTELLRRRGIPLAGFYYCPHAPLAENCGRIQPCKCRKPAPGLITQALRDHSVDREHSWLVGDILDDVEAGVRAGLRTILLRNGGETKWEWSPLRVPHHVADNLNEAVRAILAHHAVQPRAACPSLASAAVAGAAASTTAFTE